ncbi:MAG: nuclear transport factor 2 family protein [Thalassobaculum sp.]|uniref:YybH family protein n=1 Tax=Thalassobaculum sp. TaxID=2022740 RepID=UPI0032ED82DE
MRNAVRSTAVLALTLVTLAHATAARADEAAVRAAADRFYAALNVMFTGDVQPMLEVWSHADDITYMGPGGGLHVGWVQVAPIWKATAEMKLGGSVEPTEMRVNAGADLAVTSNYEVGRNIVDGKTETVTIRATNIFRLENGQWKMIGHHTDLLSFLAK